MKDDQHGDVTEASDLHPSQGADAVDVRTKAVVAALRAALDKVYSEDGEQQVRRLARDYGDWSGEAIPGPQAQKNGHK